MGIKKSGFKETKRMLHRAVPIAERKFETINRQNAEDVADVARALIPKRTGVAGALIRLLDQARGTLIDFGPLSRILEGGTQDRQTKAGKNRGKGPRRPFVNPALAATRRIRNARNRKGVRDAWKEARGGG